MLKQIDLSMVNETSNFRTPFHAFGTPNYLFVCYQFSNAHFPRAVKKMRARLMVRDTEPRRPNNYVRVDSFMLTPDQRARLSRYFPNVNVFWVKMK
jgi:hypothetical protein